MKTSNVTIVGGGIVGICTALSLQDRGINVRLIDKDDPGQATSFGNAGVISPWSIIPHSTPGFWKTIPKLMLGSWRPLSISPAFWHHMIPWGLKFLLNGTEKNTIKIADAMSMLCAPCIELYRKHLNGTGHEYLVKDTGYLQLVRNTKDATLEDLAFQIRLQKGAKIEIVKGSALRLLEPALSSKFEAGILTHNVARSLLPGKLSSVLAKKAKAQGAEIIKDQIIKINKSDDCWSLEGNVSKYTAQSLVISAGAWSRELLTCLGLSVPLMTERGYHIHCADPEIEINNSVVFPEAGVIASLMEGGVRIAGQAEFGPIDAPFDAKRKSILSKIALEMFPDISLRKTKVWMGHRPSFPDSIPVIGSVPKQPNLFVNFGHSHHGLMMAPKSGEVLANALIQNSVNEDTRSVSITRFLN